MRGRSDGGAEQRPAKTFEVGVGGVKRDVQECERRLCSAPARVQES